jgi:hypothetical protein
MALGRDAIDKARTSMRNIQSNVDSTEGLNKKFRELFTDANFQQFVKETNKGASLNEQLKSLNEWITSMTQVVEGLEDKTNGYLATQESLNE